MGELIRLTKPPFICCENDETCMSPCSAHPWSLGGINRRSAPEREHAPWCTWRSGGWTALGTCDCGVSSMMLSEADFDRMEESRSRDGVGAIRMFRWFICAALFYAAVSLWACSVSHATDHGWNEASPFAQWVRSLRRPDSGYKWSCCGKGDLYPVKIKEDAIGDTGDSEGTLVITDGSPITYPDGQKRPAIPNGTVLHFPKSKVNDRQGNPTTTAFAFIGSGEYIWCVIPLPPNT